MVAITSSPRPIRTTNMPVLLGRDRVEARQGVAEGPQVLTARLGLQGGGERGVDPGAGGGPGTGEHDDRAPARTRVGRVGDFRGEGRDVVVGFEGAAGSRDVA